MADSISWGLFVRVLITLHYYLGSISGAPDLGNSQLAWPIYTFCTRACSGSSDSCPGIKTKRVGETKHANKTTTPCVHLHLPLHTYIHASMHAYRCARNKRLHIYVHTHAHVHTKVCTCIYVYIHSCACTSIYLSVSICIYVYIYIYW